MQIIRRAATAPRRPLYEIETDNYEMKPVTGRVAIFDTETDPFKRDRIVKPFTCGVYFPDDGYYRDFWGDDCIDQFFAWLAAEHADTEISFFVHNGGGFDFYFCTEYFDEDMKPFIINGRLVRIEMRGYEFRDSYAMIPVALGNALKAEDGGKIEIDYSKFERECREQHKAEILHYQRQDCIALGALVVEWLAMFGNRLTMASVALPMLRSYHGFETLNDNLDKSLRPFYFGGRCQTFETGVIHGRFFGYDITSSYPDVMRRIKHPISGVPIYETRITPKTVFARIRAWSNGALPIRKDDGGLDFPVGVFDFYACIHEINAGLETGTLRIQRVYETIYFSHMATFDTFIDTFFDLRVKADSAGDEIKKLFYKLVMNSSYGKFAQDPRKYENWLFDPKEMPSPTLCGVCKDDRNLCENCKEKKTSPYGWYLHTMHSGRCIYARPQRVSGSGFYNVATAASITSAARASLLYGIASAKRPLYCDTDSLICEALTPTDRVIIGPKQLGAWKLEFEANEVAIAGKKLYAVFNHGQEVKKASKGVKLEASEIKRVANGETIEYANPVPKMSIFKEEGGKRIAVNDVVTAQFITRQIRRTGDANGKRTLTGIYR